MASKTTQLHFARFEFKYILPLALRQQIEEELQFFLEFDPYVAAQPNHQYFVRSLYFDDPHFTCFYDKTEGLRTRSKFRIRTYSADPADNAPFFMEIKGRHNNLVFKHRVPLPGGPEEMHFRGDALSQEVLKRAPNSAVKSQFEFELHRRRLRPVALIDYNRRPYISKYDAEFRLTFDDNLHATLTDTLFPAGWERCRSILSGYTVMEVKFRHQMPAWFHRIIQSYELRRVSISKICAGLQALEVVEDVS